MMHWLEALESYLAESVRPRKGYWRVIGAIVETAAGPPQTSIPCELVGGWWVEERTSTRGNIAIHLFPSVV